jgi:hypothetical protein
MFYDQSRYYEMPSAFHTRQSFFPVSLLAHPHTRMFQIKRKLRTTKIFLLIATIVPNKSPMLPPSTTPTSAAPALYGQLDTGFGHDSVTHQQYNTPVDTAERAAFSDDNVAVSLPTQLGARSDCPCRRPGTGSQRRRSHRHHRSPEQNKNDGKPAPPPVDHDSLTALVNARERDVKRLLATLATPLANWNANFIWHCIMKLPGACE